MKTKTILKNIRNPFVDERDEGFVRMLGYAVYGICILVCTLALPVVALGWVGSKVVDKLSKG